MAMGKGGTYKACSYRASMVRRGTAVVHLACGGLCSMLHCVVLVEL